MTTNTEIKNNRTVTRGRWEGIIGRKGRSVFRNNCKGHMDKTKVGVEAGEGGKNGWGRGESGEGQMQTTVLEQQ